MGQRVAKQLLSNSGAEKYFFLKGGLIIMCRTLEDVHPRKLGCTWEFFNFFYETTSSEPSIPPPFFNPSTNLVKKYSILVSTVVSVDEYRWTGLACAWLSRERSSCLSLSFHPYPPLPPCREVLHYLNGS